MMEVLLYDRFAASREELLRRHLATRWTFASLTDVSDHDRAAELISRADALIGNTFPAAMKTLARNLRLIHCVGAGVDGFDWASLPPGCVLCNVYEHEIPMAEYIVLVCLLFATRLECRQAAFREGQWEGSGRYDGVFHDEIHGRTLGLIGFGHIGKAVAPRARAMGMRVTAVTRTPAPHPCLDSCGDLKQLDRLLGESDFVAVICPLNEKTRGLLGEPQLRRLKPTACLINPARAQIVDEAALYTALKEKWFAGAALDVWYQYPPDTRTAMHGSRFPFHELDNVIVTPHMSAWTQPLIERRYRRIAENLDRFARGEPLERIVYRA